MEIWCFRPNYPELLFQKCDGWSYHWGSCHWRSYYPGAKKAEYSQLPLISPPSVLAKSGDICELWHFWIYDVISSSSALSPISCLGFISDIITSHLTLLTKLNPSQVADQTLNLLNMMLIAFPLFPAYSRISSRYFSASEWGWNSGGGPDIYFSSASVFPEHYLYQSHWIYFDKRIFDDAAWLIWPSDWDRNQSIHHSLGSARVGKGSIST